MLGPSEIKRGLIIDIDGAPCVVESVTMQTPSSRSANSIWKVRARNLKSKQKVDKAFRSGDAVVEPNFEKRDVQFLYTANSVYHFMDLQDFDQFALAQAELGKDTDFLVDNMEGLRALVLDGEVIGVELPLTVELKITACDPSVRGNSATARSKSATLESGAVIQVPEHLAEGDRVRVDTVTGKFVARASK